MLYQTMMSEGALLLQLSSYIDQHDRSAMRDLSIHQHFPDLRFSCRAAVTSKGRKFQEISFEVCSLYYKSYLVDPASSHMLVSKIKPCMSKYKQIYM